MGEGLLGGLHARLSSCVLFMKNYHPGNCISVLLLNTKIKLENLTKKERRKVLILFYATAGN